MIVITGAAGFIGSNLAHRLAGSGTELLLVDHELNPAKAANFVGLGRFQFRRHDHFLQDLEAGCFSPAVIYHLGACSATTETNWSYLEQNNIEYTRRLWLWSAKNQIPFLYASSAATYGDGSLGFDDQIAPEKLQPLNLYGKSKNDFDIWALQQVNLGKLVPPTWAGLKFFNVYGPREQHKGRMSSVVWQTYQQIQLTGRMKLFRSTDPKYPDGGQLRDFVFVEDCVDHLIWLASQKSVGGLFNSGTGQARSFYDLAAATFHAMGRPTDISFIDMPKDLARQYQNFTQAAMQSLQKTGNSKLPTSLEAGIEHYVKWLQQAHPVRQAA
ncbi:ADP-glyceromanno-heptose 6-epimerase [Telmatocola sphagniphila]|uniref:ADP-glyceromanno-heptose 6-epimerase n=1 Tax=Telmatocola sphagniphila TaxID=1123043 RepID=A0A8E6B4S7_9BACT|nr:ADP-glyceromanno-heptose 6-epimerase [Telmatocola sphagniphila]QVL31756.1 ADP-glyceromanno-heptose 6-epimerase [Telmatocola sphagniphila]